MNKNIKRALRKRLKRQAKAAGKSLLHVGGNVLRGEDPARAIEREVQSKVDRALHKAQSHGSVSGRGAYGRGAYGRGAYGRGSYSRYGEEAGMPATNSLFTESKLQRSNFKSAGDETGRIVVSRREYVTRVVSPATPGDFSVTSYNINPGLSGVFAWLSQIASNFEEYEFYGCVFSYQPVISTATTTGAMGSVVVACNYNAGSPKFLSFREMVEYQGAIEGRICDPIDFGIECDPSKNAGHDMEYVRSGPVPSGEDIKSYDIGTFQMATADVSASAYPAGTLLGHVYVDYKIRLGKPKLFAALGKNIMTDVIRGSTGCTDALPLGTAPYGSIQNTIGGTVTRSVSSVYTFPSNFQGNVFVKFQTESSVADDSAPAINEAGNVTQLTEAGYNGSLYSEFADGDNGMRVVYFRVGPQEGAVENTLTFVGGFGTGTRWGGSLLITVVNPDVINSDIQWQAL